MKTKLIVLLSIFALLSCGSKKKIIENTSVEKELVLTKDSVVFIEKSLPINDAVFISLKTGDKKTDSIVNLKFQNFQTSKISGNNNVTAVFDTQKKGLKIITKLAGSSDKKTTTNNTTNKNEKTVKNRVESQKSSGFGFNWWLLFACLLVVLAIIIFLKFF